MALVLTFPCGRCGKKYSIYYPKAFIYSVYGTGTRARGEREDAEEVASGAVEVPRRDLLIVHPDLASSVDLILAGLTPQVELRGPEGSGTPAAEPHDSVV